MIQVSSRSVFVHVELAVDLCHLACVPENQHHEYINRTLVSKPETKRISPQVDVVEPPADKDVTAPKDTMNQMTSTLVSSPSVAANRPDVAVFSSCVMSPRNVANKAALARQTLVACNRPSLPGVSCAVLGVAGTLCQALPCGENFQRWPCTYCFRESTWNK